MASQQTVQDVMTKQVVTVQEETPVREIARIMSDQDIGDVLVTDGAGKLVGILTDRDIVVRAVADGSELELLRARDICTHDHIVTLEPSAGLDEAVRLMSEKAIRRLPIVENDVPVGIVSIGDLAAVRDPRSALGQISTAAPNN